LEGEGVAADEAASAVAPWASELFSRAARIAFVTAIPSERRARGSVESAGGQAGLLREISRGGMVLELRMVRLFCAKTDNRNSPIRRYFKPSGASSLLRHG
jgi:hypothetical protein